jgi:lipopolysaccharide biosynthesis glycosyltransferase
MYPAGLRLNKESIVVACVADDAYAMPLAVTLASASSHLDEGRMLDIYVVDAGIEEGNKQRIVRSLDPARASLTWVPHAGARLVGLPVWGRMSIHTYQRILAADLLPATQTKVIWLDSDLVVRADLTKLWRLELSGRTLLAAQDMLAPVVSSPLGLQEYRALGFEGHEKYFNAGVMVLDLDRWRRDRIAEKVIAYLRQHRGNVVLWDQDGLNAVLRDQWGELDLRWNQNAAVCGRPFFDAGYLDPAAYRKVLEDPWIVHFSGNLKPWLYRMKSPAHSLYFEYLDKTAWAGWRPRRTLTSALLEKYESSVWRNVAYPAEAWVMRLWRAFTMASAPTPVPDPSQTLPRIRR